MALLPKLMQSRLLCKSLSTCLQRAAKCSTSAIQIRPVHAKEAATLAIGQVDEDIRFTSDDCKIIHSLDRNGFFIATTESGEIAGTVAAPRLSETEGFVGFLNVQEEFKDRGLEARLWETAMNYLEDCKNIGIEIPPDDVESCQEFGFKEVWRNGIFKGVGVQLVKEVQSSNVVRHTRDMPFSQVVYYDAGIVGYERPLFLQKWNQVQKPAVSLAIFEREDVVGYGVLRPLHRSNSYRIGPLYSNNVAIAQILILSLINDIPEKTVYITTPLGNPSFVELLKKDLRMENVGEMVRMYSAGSCDIPTHKMFGVLSSDVG